MPGTRRKPERSCVLQDAALFEGCRTQFRTQFPDPEAVSEVALIDHNELDIEQNDIASKVTRVIDHHVDSGAYADTIVEK